MGVKLKESMDLMRIGSTEIKANPDGIDLGGSMFEFLKFFGLLKQSGSRNLLDCLYKYTIFIVN